MISPAHASPVLRGVAKGPDNRPRSRLYRIRRQGSPTRSLWGLPSAPGGTSRRTGRQGKRHALPVNAFLWNLPAFMIAGRWASGHRTARASSADCRRPRSGQRSAGRRRCRACLDLAQDLGADGGRLRMISTGTSARNRELAALLDLELAQQVAAVTTFTPAALAVSGERSAPSSTISPCLPAVRRHAELGARSFMTK